MPISRRENLSKSISAHSGQDRTRISLSRFTAVVFLSPSPYQDPISMQSEKNHLEKNTHTPDKNGIRVDFHRVVGNWQLDTNFESKEAFFWSVGNIGEKAISNFRLKGWGLLKTFFSSSTAGSTCDKTLVLFNLMMSFSIPCVFLFYFLEIKRFQISHVDNQENFTPIFKGKF